MSGESLAVAVAAKALDGLSMRMAAIADNLANVASPNFRATKVEFERALEAAARRGGDAVAQLKLDFQPGEIFGPGDERRMDLMLADAAQTAARYAALVAMLGKRFSIQAAAMGGQG